MKAISLMQPWASLVAIGTKKIETRSWSTEYRGQLAIHSSKGFKKYLRQLCCEEPFKTVLNKAGLSLDNLPLGRVVATCKLVDCIEMTPEFIDRVKSAKGHEYDFGEYAVGRYAWILEDIKALDNPVPAKGKLSIWKWEGKS
ncbi:ASCH domain-containing protein [Desulfosporosinus youngiae]|uniref:2-oxoglutarate dehydrogenase complex, dehydrogenase E1 component-like protein n=1 Tax=Desulfosporosinus youngiae DSM 17734 TaxID=768710 RepID=H5Y263_9FIRM|nr:ASCH domain-containing protein [Desulfosporosinus youngiae]EHQ88261.1 2-oxoglutarate dehydrogenase complex, dehydrogenase E1 component-like protein [Desulfosporosinus youngiae DSM 17734]